MSGCRQSGNPGGRSFRSQHVAQRKSPHSNGFCSPIAARNIACVMELCLNGAIPDKTVHSRQLTVDRRPFEPPIASRSTVDSWVDG
jgi:hypothetical protein